jgi:hypothetical protein
VAGADSPRIVCIRVTIDPKSLSDILDFLQVARDRRVKIAEDVAFESVKALHSLHQIRYQALRLNMYRASTRFSKIMAGCKIALDQQGTLNIDDFSTSCTTCTLKRLGYASADDDYGETRLLVTLEEDGKRCRGLLLKEDRGLYDRQRVLIIK